MVQKGRFTRSELDVLHERMYGGSRDFCFSVTREDMVAIQQPLLVFMGKDRSHPSETSRELAKLAPNATLVEKWRDGDADPSASERLIQEFLIRHWENASARRIVKVEA